MRYLVILIFSLLEIGLYAQENCIIVNNHLNDVDKNDVNQLYVNKKTKKIKKLDSNYFSNGLIIKQLDTIECKIYLKNNKINKDLYSFVLVKLDTSKNVHVLTGKDISGFIVKKDTFLSYCSNSGMINSYSFIRLVSKGKVILYERESIPSNSDFVYLFKKFNYNGLSILTPFSENIKYYSETTSEDGSKYFSISTNKIDEKFKIAFKSYFSDCPQVVNKILSGFYTIKDFKIIVNEYNSSCK